ncbi:MAG: flavin reductase family protein [Hyphomicrobiales bacterium]
MTQNQTAQRPAAGAIDAKTFREGMSRIASTVHIVTTDGAAGRAGLTVTAMTPVSDEPPTLLVCINRLSTTNSILRRNGVFAVNVLPAGADDLSNVFAGRDAAAGAKRFEHGTWSTGATGAPLLAGARVSFDCRITDIHDVGTHSIVIGTVVGAQLGARGAALGYIDRDYRDL